MEKLNKFNELNIMGNTLFNVECTILRAERYLHIIIEMGVSASVDGT